MFCNIQLSGAVFMGVPERQLRAEAAAEGVL